MQKLSKIPKVSNQILMWIHDFLLDRKQKVILEKQLSAELSVTSGVPQGSVLGPTLFLAYINDLPELVNCSISLFPDDTLIYQVANDSLEKSKFQTNINALHHWAKNWCMSFNIDRCFILAFNATANSPSATNSLDGIPLSIVEKTKYLGVTLQSNLKFDRHIYSVILKAIKKLGMNKRTLHNAPQGAKLLAYTSLCRPHVEYAATVWDSPLGYLSEDIEMVQNKAIRFISSLRGRVSISEERANLKLKTLAERRKKSRHSLLIQLLSHGENYRFCILI